MAKRDNTKKIGDNSSIRFTRKSGATDELMEWLNKQPGNYTSKLMKTARLAMKLDKAMTEGSHYSMLIKSLFREIDNEMLLLKYGNADNEPSALPSSIDEHSQYANELLLDQVNNNQTIDQVVHQEQSNQEDSKENDRILELVKEKPVQEVTRKVKKSEPVGQISNKHGAVPMRRF